jgi:hypothetical protein
MTFELYCVSPLFLKQRGINEMWTQASLQRFLKEKILNKVQKWHKHTETRVMQQNNNIGYTIFKQG